MINFLKDSAAFLFYMKWQKSSSLLKQELYVF